MAEQVFCWTATVPNPRHRTAVRRLLRAINRRLEHDAEAVSRNLPMVHFASVTLFESGDHAAAPVVIVENNIDGPYAAYVKALVAAAERPLRKVFSRCDPPLKPADDVARYLTARRTSPRLFHLGHPGLSVQEIRGDWELRRSIVRALAESAPLRSAEPEEILRQIRGRIRVKTGLGRRLRRPWHHSWDEPPGDPVPLEEIQWPPATWEWWWAFRGVLLYAAAVVAGVPFTRALQILEISRGVAIAIWAAIVFGFIQQSAPDARRAHAAMASGIVAAAIWMIFAWYPFSAPGWGWAALAALTPLLISGAAYFNVVRQLTVTDVPPPLDAGQRAGVGNLAEAEDREVHSIYNHVAGLSPLKRDPLRWRWLRTTLALMFLNLFYRTQFVKGKLATIPSIHFAQWTFIDRGRLLFVTNYDGGADSYLDDFFDALANGVAFIWHDTKPFPHTTDTRRLKRWVREAQTLAAVRYRAPVYDGLTVTAIMNNLSMRKGLLRGVAPGSARRWLSRFVTTPPDPTYVARLATWLRERRRSVPGGH
jgi:hypothetical protein